MAMSQCRLIVARPSAEGEPAPLDAHEDHPAKKLLENFAGGMGGQAELLDSVGTYFTVPGEFILIGSDSDPEHPWRAYSSSELRNGGRSLTVRTADGGTGDWVVPPELLTTAVRVFRPYPRFSWQADSPARAALPILTEIMMYDARLRASTISRLTGAGFLLLPEGLTLPGLEAKDDGDDDGDPTMRLLMEVMKTAIGDQDSAAAKVPVIGRGEPEDIAAVRWITFWSELDDKIMELRDSAIDRLAVAVDMPAEILKGLGDTQHWTGSLITDQWVGHYLSSQMTTLCGSLTTGYLWRNLDPTERDVIVWFDASSLRTRPNQGQEAQALYDKFAIGPDTLRRANGFDSGDAPTPNELLYMLLVKATERDPAALNAVIQNLGLPALKIPLPTVSGSVPSEEPGSRPGNPAVAPQISEPEIGSQPSGTSPPGAPNPPDPR